MKKIKININSKRKLSEQRNFNFRDTALAKKRSQPKSRAEKLLQSYINELEKPKLHRADYVGMKWSDSENNYVSTTEPGEISRAIGEVVKSLDMQNPPVRASDVGRNRLETAEWIYSTRTQGAAMGRGLRRGKDGKASSENFMAQYDGSVSIIPGKLNKRAKWFIKTWRTICSFAEYIVNVSDAGPKVVAPRNRDGSIMTRAQHMRMMKKNAAKLSKRDRLGPIERALYDMNPDNQPSLLGDMARAILDPRGPWGFAGRNKDGEAINNWQAFKDSVTDLKNVRTPFELQWGLGMVALSGLGLIPFVPSPSKAGGAGARGIRNAVRSTKAANAEAIAIANRIKKAAKQAEAAGEMSKAQRAKVTAKADDILAVTKHNESVLAKYPGGKVCVKKGGLKELKKKKNLNEQNVICICPPYKISDRGRIIDPETNPGAYGLGPGDELLYDTAGNYYKSTKPSQGAGQASRGASQAGIGSLRFTTNSGAPAGIIKTPNHTIVRVMVDGTPVTFLKGSGKSQLRIKYGADGRAKQIVPMEIQWYPLDDIGGYYKNTLGDVDWYPKKNSSDPKFNFKGSDDRNVPHPDMQGGQVSQYGDEWGAQMDAKHGSDWQRRMLDDDAVSDDVIAGWRNGDIYPIQRVDKWPHPESEYGKIATQINAADEAGQLEDVFGPVARINADGPTIIKWEKGELDAKEAAQQYYDQVRRNRSGAVDERLFSRRLIDIIEEEIRSVINEKT